MFRTIFFVLFAAAPAFAADPAPLAYLGIEAEPLEGDISTERPSFSTSPVPLAAGHLQLESGVQFTRIDSDADDVTLPFALLRAGLGKNLELQLGWAGYSHTEIGGRSFKGGTDMSLALKTQLTEQSGALPALGLLGQVSLPTGAKNKTSDSVDPSVGLLWTYDFARAGFFGTALLTSTTDDEDDRILQSGMGAGVGVPLAQQLSGYVEYFGIFTEHEGPQHNANAGLIYLLSKDLALDGVIGGGLNRRAPDYYVGVGASVRW
ncbi:transporter [Methylibium sp.]|uniref:transporter n=1 Tax=Methylibium sp. TaxID=2067992 RepID=UPI0025D8BAB6|nr:transporter [Methylibium sp.]